MLVPGALNPVLMSASPPYTANSVRFNATQYLARGAQFTGAADSSSLLMSLWFNMKGADGAVIRIMGNGGVYGNGYNISRNASNVLEFIMPQPGGLSAFYISSAAQFKTTTGWSHCLINYNNAAPQLYINDVVDAYTTVTLNAGSCAFTQADTWFGGISAGASLNAEIADAWWGPGQTLDLSVTANRRKFISASGHPVNLGTTGSRPTGTAPILFLSGTLASWPTNKGTGGGMTATGSLAAGSTNP